MQSPRSDLHFLNIRSAGGSAHYPVRMASMDANPYVSRGGLKLEHALRAFQLDVAGLVCADLGCSTGGFTDCLLQHGAAKVYAVDTAYGELAWKLRQDPRVVAIERTNAAHFDPRDPAGSLTARSKSKAAKLIPPDFAGVDLVVIDLGWTKQQHALPAARRWLPPPPEVSFAEATPPAQTAGVNASGSTSGGGRFCGVISLVKPHYESGEHQLDEAASAAVTQRVLDEVAAAGWRVLGATPCPVHGGKGGNQEWLALLTR